MASTKKMSWYTPVPARRAHRRRITSGTKANAARGRGARLEYMLTPTPALSPSPSLYESASGLDGIDVGISRDTYTCRHCNHHSKQARSWVDNLPRCRVQRSEMGRNLARPNRPNAAVRAN